MQFDPLFILLVDWFIPVMGFIYLFFVISSVLALKQSTYDKIRNDFCNNIDKRKCVHVYAIHIVKYYPR